MKFSICGDEVKEAKPSAEPLLILCKRAKVAPRDCIVVGDTSADMGMGRNSKAGLIIGVLTGTGTTDYLLEKGAHCVLPDISYISKLIGYAEKSFHETPEYCSPSLGQDNMVITLNEIGITSVEEK